MMKYADLSYFCLSNEVSLKYKLLLFLLPTTTNNYKVHPSHAHGSNIARSHYEQVDNHQNSIPKPRLVFDRDCHDELQHFNAMLTQFNCNSQNNMPPNMPQKSQTATVKSDQFSLHCEADNECEGDDLSDEASSLTASHKSDHY